MPARIIALGSLGGEAVYAPILVSEQRRFGAFARIIEAGVASYRVAR